MSDHKATVLALVPDAVCKKFGSLWYCYWVRPTQRRGGTLGIGKTAALAWAKAAKHIWRNQP